MAAVLTLPQNPPEASHLVPGVLGAGLGVGFTLLLFLGLAHIEHATPEAPVVEFADLRSVAFPVEPPPPAPPSPRVAPAETAGAPEVGGLGFDKGDTGSPTKITVAPREISQLLPARATAPSMRVLAGAHYSELKPKLDGTAEFQKIYQQTEVDQRPQILIEGRPYVPPVVRNGAQLLKITLLFVVDTTGAVTSVRILRTSGNAYFDDIMVDCAKGWVFSPAVKRGKRVKCMVQRDLIVKWTSNPFEN